MWGFGGKSPKIARWEGGEWEWEWGRFCLSGNIPGVLERKNAKFRRGGGTRAAPKEKKKVGKGGKNGLKTRKEEKIPTQTLGSSRFPFKASLPGLFFPFQGFFFPSSRLVFFFFFGVYFVLEGAGIDFFYYYFSSFSSGEGERAGGKSCEGERNGIKAARKRLPGVGMGQENGDFQLFPGKKWGKNQILGLK